MMIFVSEKMSQKEPGDGVRALTFIIIFSILVPSSAKTRKRPLLSDDWRHYNLA